MPVSFIEKMILFPLKFLWHFCWKSVCHLCVSLYFYNIQFHSLMYLSWPQCHTVLIIPVLEQGRNQVVQIFQLCSPFFVLVWLSRCFTFKYQLWNQFAVSRQKTFWKFDRYCIESIDHYGKKWYLNNIVLQLINMAYISYIPFIWSLLIYLSEK